MDWKILPDGIFRLQVPPGHSLVMSAARGQRTVPDSQGDINDVLQWHNPNLAHYEYVTEYMQRAVVRLQPADSQVMDFDQAKPELVRPEHFGFILKDADQKPTVFPAHLPEPTVPEWAVQNGFALFVGCYMDAGRRHMSDCQVVWSDETNYHLGLTNPEGLHNEWITYDYDVFISLPAASE